MCSSNYSNRLFGRTRGRSKKKINLKNYYETLDKYKFKNFKEQSEAYFASNNTNLKCPHSKIRGMFDTMLSLVASPRWLFSQSWF